MAHREFSDRSRIYPTGPRPTAPGGLPPWSRLGTLLALAAVVVLAAGLAQHRRVRNEARATRAEPVAVSIADLEEQALLINVAPTLPVKAEPRVMRRNETLYDALLGMGFTPEEIWGLVKAAKPFANLSRVKSGDTFTVWKKPDAFGQERIVSFQMSLAANKTLLARPTPQGAQAATAFEAELREIPYEMKLTGYTGVVTTTLWEAAMDAGMDPTLIDELADVFAFDIDFNKEVRKGDRYRLVVEQKFLEGRPAGYGRILAAEYVNGKQSHSAIQFKNGQGEIDYFATDGSSLRRMFLRSPLRYRRISSRFGGRYHPILGKWKRHEGVDYAADKGTPVRTVGDGTVLAAAYNGASGNFVKIRHNGTYETSYSHLSGYGPGIKKGARVKQGQVIGYVGSTGRSTGPHLHFAFYENGRYVDPLSKRFPAADPVPQKEKERFERAKAELLPLLPEWPTDSATASTKTTIPVPPALAAPL